MVRRLAEIDAEGLLRVEECEGLLELWRISEEEELWLFWQRGFWIARRRGREGVDPCSREVSVDLLDLHAARAPGGSELTSTSRDGNAIT